MAKVVLFNKPFDVLCQFTDHDQRRTLADYINEPKLRDVYPAGRLDRDSEGLLLLTDNGKLQHQIAHPDQKLPKTYWVQVDGVITKDAIDTLCNGVELKDGLSKPAKAKAIDEPELWPRNPPIRVRQNKPTSWLELTITEGRNRQVRRMTAAVGFPTLRLIRFAIGDWNLHSAIEASASDTHQDQPLNLLALGKYCVIEVPAPSDKPRPTTRKPKPHIKPGGSQTRKKTPKRNSTFKRS